MSATGKEAVTLEQLKKYVDSNNLSVATDEEFCEYVDIENHPIILNDGVIRISENIMKTGSTVHFVLTVRFVDGIMAGETALVGVLKEGYRPLEEQAYERGSASQKFETYKIATDGSVYIANHYMNYGDSVKLSFDMTYDV